MTCNGISLIRHRGYCLYAGEKATATVCMQVRRPQLLFVCRWEGRGYCLYAGEKAAATVCMPRLFPGLTMLKYSTVVTWFIAIDMYCPMEVICIQIEQCFPAIIQNMEVSAFWRVVWKYCDGWTILFSDQNWIVDYLCGQCLQFSCCLQVYCLKFQHILRHPVYISRQFSL